MRFRTQVSNVPLLHKIVRSLASLARLCIIRLSAEKVHFIISGNEGKDGVQVWSQVKVPTLFTQFRIESNNDNEIWLEINLDALLKVLKSADSSAGTTNEASRFNSTALSDSDVSIKLNKRPAASGGTGGQAIWVFDIKGTTALGKLMSITHEVNVNVLTKKRQDELNEPMCPPPDVHLVLPSLLDLRNIVSRLSHLAEDVKMSANHDGAMELSVMDPRVEMSMSWRNLHNPAASLPADGEADATPKDKMFSTTVSIKGLLKFLNCHLVGGTAIACICEKHCIIAYVYIGDVDEAGGVLTFFIPAKNYGDD
ncbi:checkpoint protein Hus1/Mec3 [Kockovaella imperatae]|uniref:Checkpoint protein n=1 Tax=Kockovaella imperatae TaxID=4999 RepID=A0A1Y1UA83_9TREE|nr:checkpoint protein Hus1/Mec3 [Kockovaella imperatae]ORX34922.1 checkpoint protein Hus1/Mec3 [Kockovaella imperatae]